MEIGRGTLLGIGKAIAFPIPAAVEAIADLVSPSAPPPPPPPQPLGSSLPPVNEDAKAARAEANKIWIGQGQDVAAENRTVLGRGLDITSPGAKAEVAAMEAEAQKLEKAGKKPEADALRQKAADLRKKMEAADTAAVGQTFANRKLEKAALADLSEAERAQYQKLEDHFGADPQAHLALQLLLIEGKLKAQPPNADGKNLLGALTAMSEAKLKAPLSNHQILAETVRELASPASIKQHQKNSCSAASLQIVMATERPAEYVRLMAGLASEQGEVALANGKGQPLKRLAGSELGDDTARTATSRLWQNAFMDYEAKQWDAKAHYDPKTDTVHWSDGPPTKDGMHGAGTGLATVAAMGGRWDLNDLTVKQTELVDHLKAELGKKPPKPVELTLGDQYDVNGDPKTTLKVKVTGYDPATGEFSYKLPSGGVVKTTEAELLASTQAGPGFDREAETKKMWDAVVDDVGKGQKAIVMIRLGAFDPVTGSTDEANHYVSITKIENGKVFYLNSHGTEESMAEAAFKNKLANSVTRDH